MLIVMQVDATVMQMLIGCMTLFFKCSCDKICCAHFPLSPSRLLQTGVCLSVAVLTFGTAG